MRRGDAEKRSASRCAYIWFYLIWQSQTAPLLSAKRCNAEERSQRSQSATWIYFVHLYFWLNKKFSIFIPFWAALRRPLFIKKKAHLLGW
jgi:hypothetical protein